MTEQERVKWQETACTVNNERDKLLKSWLEDGDDDFERKLRIAIQRGARLEREAAGLGVPEISRQAGILEGAADMLAELFRERTRRQAIEEHCSDPVRMKIMRTLSEADGSVRHGDLTEKTGMTYEELTEAMKMPILHEAVQAFRTGPNTRYELTPTARRFLRDADTEK